MQSWIAGWIFVFAAGMLVAILADKEERRKNRAVAIFMLAVMIAAALNMIYN